MTTNDERDARTPQASLVAGWQKIAAGLAGLAGAVAIAVQADVLDHPAVLVPVVGLIAAAVVVHVPHLGAQLLARAAWWSNLVLAVILGVLGSRSEGRAGMVLGMGCGAALLVAGRKALAEATERGQYRPAAFKTTLQLVMVLALADAQMLLLMGIVELDRHRASGPVLLGAVVTLLVGFIGLYRLAIWGVLLTVGTSAFLAVVQLTRIVETDSDFRGPIVVLAMLQVLATAPMLLSLFTGRPLPSLSPRARGLGATIAIVGLMVLSVVSGLN